MRSPRRSTPPTARTTRFSRQLAASAGDRRFLPAAVAMEVLVGLLQQRQQIVLAVGPPVGVHQPRAVLHVVRTRGDQRFENRDRFRVAAPMQEIDQFRLAAFDQDLAAMSVGQHLDRPVVPLQAPEQ
jgi:hypothetical protein